MNNSFQAIERRLSHDLRHLHLEVAEKAFLVLLLLHLPDVGLHGESTEVLGESDISFCDSATVLLLEELLRTADWKRAMVGRCARQGSGLVKAKGQSP